MNGTQAGNFAVMPVPGRRIVRVALTGSMTLDDVDRLAVVQAELVRTLGYRPGRFDALIDATGLPIQAMAVSDALRALSLRDDFRPARLAFVHGNASVKMQLRRVNADKHAGFFVTEDEALVWLDTDRPGPGG